MRQVVAAARSSSTATSSLECRNEARVGHSHPRVMSHAARARRAPAGGYHVARPSEASRHRRRSILPARFPLSACFTHVPLPPRAGRHSPRSTCLARCSARSSPSVHHPLLAHSHAHAHSHALAQTRLHTHGHAHKNAGAMGAEARTGVVCEQVRARELDGRRPGRGAAAAGAAAAAVALVQAEVDQRRDLRRRKRLAGWTSRFLPSWCCERAATSCVPK